MLIYTIWLNSVKFVLPKWFSLPKIFCTIWMINQCYFPVTFTTMNIICKMSVKWLLVNFPIFAIVTMHTPIIIKPSPKFVWPFTVLFMASFAWYQITTFLDLQFRFSSLISYVRFCSRSCKTSSSSIMFSNFKFRSFTRVSPTFIFNLWYFSPHKVSSKLLALRNRIIRTPRNILLCSLSGVKKRVFLSLGLLVEPEKSGTQY